MRHAPDIFAGFGGFVLVTLALVIGSCQMCLGY
jgi:hypothetical protein